MHESLRTSLLQVSQDNCYFAGGSGGSCGGCEVRDGCVEVEDSHHLSGQGKRSRGWLSWLSHGWRSRFMGISRWYSCCYGQKVLCYSPACPESYRASPSPMSCLSCLPSFLGGSSDFDGSLGDLEKLNTFKLNQQDFAPDPIPPSAQHAGVLFSLHADGFLATGSLCTWLLRDKALTHCNGLGNWTV